MADEDERERHVGLEEPEPVDPGEEHVHRADAAHRRPQVGALDVEVDVRDVNGKATQSEVTLWAVDYGVLSLTAFRTPDVLKSVYVEKALQVFVTKGWEAGGQATAAAKSGAALR